jgi:hypothetical protein
VAVMNLNKIRSLMYYAAADTPAGSRAV